MWVYNLVAPSNQSLWSIALCNLCLINPKVFPFWNIFSVHTENIKDFISRFADPYLNKLSLKFFKKVSPDLCSQSLCRGLLYVRFFYLGPFQDWRGSAKPFCSALRLMVVLRQSPCAVVWVESWTIRRLWHTVFTWIIDKLWLFRYSVVDIWHYLLQVIKSEL